LYSDFYGNAAALDNAKNVVEVDLKENKGPNCTRTVVGDRLATVQRHVVGALNRLSSLRRCLTVGDSIGGQPGVPTSGGLCTKIRIASMQRSPSCSSCCHCTFSGSRFTECESA
jgi:hypothetical protein